MTTISVENPIVNDLDEAKRSATNENRDEGRGNNDDEKEDYEENSGGEGALHSSTATITSSTASHASSSESPQFFSHTSTMGSLSTWTLQR